MNVDKWAREEWERRITRTGTVNDFQQDIFGDVFTAGAVARDEYLAERLLSDETVRAHINAQREHELDYHYDSGLVLGCACGVGYDPLFRTNNEAYEHVARAAIEAALAVATGNPEPRLVEPPHCGCPCHHDGGATKHITACCTTKSQTGADQ